jgi:hypothetical protein
MDLNRPSAEGRGQSIKRWGEAPRGTCDEVRGMKRNRRKVRRIEEKKHEAWGINKYLGANR